MATEAAPALPCGAQRFQPLRVAPSTSVPASAWSWHSHLRNGQVTPFRRARVAGNVCDVPHLAHDTSFGQHASGPLGEYQTSVWVLFYFSPALPHTPILDRLPLAAPCGGSYAGISLSWEDMVPCPDSKWSQDVGITLEGRGSPSNG